MKVVKPLRLGVMYRTFEHANRCYLTVAGLVLFPFDEPDVILPEVNLWKLMATELGEQGVLDECIAKSRSEVLVSGQAYPPGTRPAPGCKVRLVCGPIHKELFVVGDRVWLNKKPSEPVPFEAMPVSWEHAYGGKDFEPNPLGKGHGEVEHEDGTRLHPLPNVEDPKQVVASPKDQPAPAGFGAYELQWPQRFRHVGTYDTKWLEEQFPGFALDLNWAFFNRAPEDQWLPEHFRGDETFSVENMHPELALVEGRLPAVRVRCFVTEKGRGPGELVEVPLRADTLHLFPNALKGVLIFHGTREVVEDDAADIVNLLLAAEATGDSPRPLSHYATALEQRLDREKAHLYALRDSDLMPPVDPERKPRPDEAYSDMDDLLKTEELLIQRQRRHAELELEKARQLCIEHGVDPDEHFPKELPELEQAPALEELPDYVDSKMAEVEEQKKLAEQQRVQLEAEARERCAAAGIDYDEAVKKAQQDGAGPPKFSAAEEIRKLEDQRELARNAGVPLPHVEEQLADPELFDKLRQAERGFKDAYRRAAHLYPAAAAMPGEQAELVRVQVVAARDSGESLAGRDLTGADLSGADLSGADLRDAFLEAAKLAQTNLSGADLRGCVLTRADLTDARLDGAKLAGANLGEAKLIRASARGTDLSEAVLAKADLTEACLAGSELAKADLSEATLAGADLSEIRMRETWLLRTDLSKLCLRGADLTKCDIVECSADGTDLSGASLEQAALVTVRGKGTSFRNAKAAGMCVVHESSLPGADFHGAELSRVNLRGTNLEGADLSEAKLDGADLSECNLQGASLRLSSAVEALLVRADLRNADLAGANLMQAIVQKANLRGADLHGSNLFRADMARIQGDEATNLKGANMKQIRFVRRGDDGLG